MTSKLPIFEHLLSVENCDFSIVSIELGPRAVYDAVLLPLFWYAGAVTSGRSAVPGGGPLAVRGRVPFADSVV